MGTTCFGPADTARGSLSMKPTRVSCGIKVHACAGSGACVDAVCGRRQGGLLGASQCMLVTLWIRSEQVHVPPHATKESSDIVVNLCTNLQLDKLD